MVHLQPRSLHALKKSESSVNHLDERIFEKCSSHFIFFLKAAWPTWVSFLLITIPNQKKRTRIKKKYFVGKTANDWILTLQVTGAIIRLPLVFFFDVMIMTDNYVDNHHQNRYNYFYHTHLEIIGDPCKLLGSHWCDEITNCTLFCS